MNKLYAFLILIIISLLLPAVCLSELKGEYDDSMGRENAESVLSNVKYYSSSSQSYNYLDELKFHKAADSSNYCITLANSFNIHENMPGPYKDEIIINGASYRLHSVTDTAGIDYAGYDGNIASTVQYALPEEIIEKIKTAASVVIKYAGSDLSFTRIDLPPTILKEWQRVISIYESGQKDDGM